MNNLIYKLNRHLRQLAPHQQERDSGILLLEARDMLVDQQINAAIGAAINRAAAELPEGYDLHIEIEKDAGTVRLYLPDTDASMDEFDSGDTFADQINNAIDYAKEHKE